MPINFDLAAVEDLKATLQREPDQLVPFVGAGMSKAAGFKLWGELVSDLLGYAENTLSKTDYERLVESCSECDYPKQLEQLLFKLGRNAFDSRIRTLFGGKPKSKDLSFIRPITTLGVRYIMTTNLDQCIENSCSSRLDPKVYLPESESFPSELDSRGGLRIIKWHGDIDKSATWVLTETQYNEHYGSAWRLAWLQQFATSRRFLFLGCSMSDPDVTQILQRAGRSAKGNKPPHFILLKEEDGQASELDRDAFRKYNIAPIWYTERAEIQEFLRTLSGKGKPPSPRVKLRTETAEPVKRAQADAPWFMTITGALGNFPAALERLEAGKYSVLKFEPGDLIENTNHNHHQSVEEMVKRLDQMPAQVLIGPQLSGKTWLAYRIVEEVKRKQKDPTCVVPETVWPSQAERLARNSPFATDPGSAKFHLYASWAQNLVIKAFDEHAKPEEKTRLRAGDRAGPLADYMNDLKTVEDDILYHHNKLSRLRGAPFIAVERSVLIALDDAKIVSPELILFLEVEDLHLYAESASSTSRVGEAILQQFWDDIYSYADRGRRTQPSVLKGSMKIIVATLQRAHASQPNLPSLPATYIQPFPLDDCVRFASRTALANVFSQAEIAELAESTHRNTNGYAWFVARYLRLAFFLRSACEAAKVAQIEEALLKYPQFWYFKDPCSRNGWMEVHNTIAAGKVFPQVADFESAFLTNVRQRVQSNSQLTGAYAQLMKKPGAPRGGTEKERVVLPLMRLGLIRFDEDTPSYEFSNEIIKRHFSPEWVSKIAAAGPVAWGKS